MVDGNNFVDKKAKVVWSVCRTRAKVKRMAGTTGADILIPNRTSTVAVLGIKSQSLESVSYKPR